MTATAAVRTWEPARERERERERRRAWERGRRRVRRNPDALRTVGDLVAEDPRRYDQGEWGTRTTCGTRACVAGLAATLHPRFARFGPGYGMATINVDLRSVPDVAREVLGLTGDETDVLFSGAWLPRGVSRPVARSGPDLAARVRDALYALADGASVGEVTAPAVPATPEERADWLFSEVARGRARPAPAGD